MYPGKKIHFDSKLQKQFENSLYKKDLSNKALQNSEPAENSYSLFVNRFKHDKIYEFEIFGEKGTYNPVFKIEDGQILSACNCRAGLKNKSCWHRSYILLGNKERLTNINHINNLNLMIEEFKSFKLEESAINVEYKHSQHRNESFRLAFSHLSFLFTSLF